MTTKTTLMKRSLAAILILCLSTALVQVPSFAAENPYPDKQTFNGVTTLPCTYYAWQQAHDRVGVSLPPWGNAGMWLDNAVNAGWETGSTAEPNSIAVWTDNAYGHVAYVTEVNSGRMTVDEGGRTAWADTTGGIAIGETADSTVGSVRWGSYILAGFIYLTDSEIPSNGSDKNVDISAMTFLTVTIEKTAWDSALISWNAVEGAERYEVQYRREAGGNYTATDWRADPEYQYGTSYISTDMLNLTYHYRVRAITSAGETEWVSVDYTNGRDSFVQSSSTPIVTSENKPSHVDPVEHVHQLVHVGAQKESCTEVGNIEYWYCTDCDKYYLDSNAFEETYQAALEIPMSGHSLTRIAAQEATCTTEGNTTYWRCDICGKYFTNRAANDEISPDECRLPPLGHSYQNGVCVLCGEVNHSDSTLLASEDGDAKTRIYHTPFSSNCQHYQL